MDGLKIHGDVVKDCKTSTAGFHAKGADSFAKWRKGFLNFFSLEEKKQKNRTQIFLLK